MRSSDPKPATSSALAAPSPASGGGGRDDQPLLDGARWSPANQLACRRGRSAAPMTWYNDSACQDEDPELFFPIGSTGPALQQLQHAKRVCAGCPVQSRCLEWAV
jgi:hypothetical protein